MTRRPDLPHIHWPLLALSFTSATLLAAWIGG